MSLYPSVQRVSIVNFTGIRANWGCQATSWELLKFLNSAFPAGGLPQVDLIPLLPRYDIDRRLEMHQLGAIYDAMLSVCGEGTVEHGQALTFLERLCVSRYGDFAEAVKGSDIVFFQPEGTMAGTDFLRGARLLLLPFVAKHAWSKPVYALNQTILACESRFSEVLKATYNTFDFVSVRENISLSAANELNLNHVFHIPDTAFLTKPAADPRLPDMSGRGYFALTGSAYFSPHVHGQIFRAADRIRRQTGLTPVIMTSTGPDQELRRLAEKHWAPSDYAIIPANVPYCAVAFALRNCRFLFGGRFHMTILAASVGTPTIQVRGNSYKNEGLSAMLGGLSPVRDASDHERILHDTFALLDSPGRSREEVRAAVEEIRCSLREAGKWLAVHLAGGALEQPATFLEPPGSAIEASDHIELYRANSFEHARTFEYPEAAGDGLGPRPEAGNMLPCLLASWRAGDKRSLDAIFQIAASYPGIAKKLPPDVVPSLPQPPHAT